MTDWKQMAEALATSRDDWKRIADERAVEIVRLTALAEDYRKQAVTNAETVMRLHRQLTDVDRRDT